MDSVSISTNDEIVIKLLHYFITEKGYHPIILHGAKDEIWLENLDHEYKIVRIVSNYIHNDEQLEYDLFKTKQIVKKIKMKTFSPSIDTLSFFVNLGENVHLDEENCCYVRKNNDLKKYKNVLEVFPDIIEKTKFTEKGMELFLKVTEDINKTNDMENKRAEEVFKTKKPFVTYGLIILNVIMFLLMYILGDGSEDVKTLYNFGALYSNCITDLQIYRLITSEFLHIGIIHLLMNCYALYVIGPQIENFYGKTKYLIIYLLSGAIGNLFSCLLMGDSSISAGASGSIFGLLGALLYFGYHYRIYLGNVLRSQIIPIILINLGLGFILSGVNVWAHIGGLIGGVLLSMILGVKYKTTKGERIDGIVITIIIVGFLLILLLKGI